jgi:hypothetical protein
MINDSQRLLDKKHFAREPIQKEKKQDRPERSHPRHSSYAIGKRKPV